MSTSLKTFLLTTAMFLGLNAQAQAQVRVDDAWVRATVPQQQATGAFMKLTSDQDARLVKASSPLTPAVEVHEMVMEKDIMRMREVPSLPLPAGQAVELKPGGYHIMLLNLKQQVKEGDHIPLTLEFERGDGSRESVDVHATVRALTTGAGHGQSKDHGHEASNTKGH